MPLANAMQLRNTAISHARQSSSRTTPRGQLGEPVTVAITIATAAISIGKKLGIGSRMKNADARLNHARQALNGAKDNEKEIDLQVTAAEGNLKVAEARLKLAKETAAKRKAKRSKSLFAAFTGAQDGSGKGLSKKTWLVAGSAAGVLALIGGVVILKK